MSNCPPETPAPAPTIALTGDLDAFSLQQLSQQLNHAPSDARYVVLDCSRVTFIDSMGLAVLVLFARDRKVALVNRPPRVQRILEVAGLDTLFSTASS